jgi:hypothetical protein
VLDVIPPPPPAEVIVENIELLPFVPFTFGPVVPPAPPPPTVTGKVAAVSVIPVGVANGLAV